MLARLDRVEGVIESRVDWTGTHIIVRARGGLRDADYERIAAESRPILGDGARLLEGADADPHVASCRSGEPWMRAGETLELSREEARVLAAQWAARAAEAASLDEGRAARLAAVLEAELAAAFDRIHEAGASPAEGRFRAEWVTLLGRVRARAAEFLAEDEIARIVESLRSRF